MSFFINAHAEELRSLFVAHEGQKELEVKEGGNIHTVDFGKLAVHMTDMIEQNVVDPELRTWIMPLFSTTTNSDKVAASILMMGSMQKYFLCKISVCCGTLSMTLLGNREDWEQLVAKLDKIPKLGKEPTTFARLLRPVLERFVATFDRLDDPKIVDFWRKYTHETGGSGPQYLCGWITAFCFWSEMGDSLYRENIDTSEEPEKFGLDKVLSHRVETDDIPSAFTSVPVAVNDNGVVHETKIVAGMVGIQVTSSGQPMD